MSGTSEVKDTIYDTLETAVMKVLDDGYEYDDVLEALQDIIDEIETMRTDVDEEEPDDSFDEDSEMDGIG